MKKKICKMKLVVQPIPPLPLREVIQPKKIPGGMGSGTIPPKSSIDNFSRDYFFALLTHHRSSAKSTHHVECPIFSDREGVTTPLPPNHAITSLLNSDHTGKETRFRLCKRLGTESVGRTKTIQFARRPPAGSVLHTQHRGRDRTGSVLRMARFGKEKNDCSMRFAGVVFKTS